MINKKIKSSFFVMIFVVVWSSNIMALGTYTNTPSGGNANYWRDKCWDGVTVQQFEGSAADDIMNIADTHVQEFQKPLLLLDHDRKAAQIKALTSLETSVLQALEDASLAINKTMSDVESKNMKAEMEYLKTLSQQSMNEEMYGFHSEGNGLNRPTAPEDVSENENPNSAAYKSFKSMCKRGKMMSAVSSDNKKFERNQSLNNQSVSKMNEAMDISSAAQKSSQKVIEHYTNFCDAYDVSNGLCENEDLVLCEEGNPEAGVCTADGEEYELANADIDAVNFTKPKASMKNEQAKRMAMLEGFSASYTYDEEQLKGAEAYADTVVYSSLPESPTTSELRREDKSQYVAAYNSHMASLNLAYNSFAYAMSEREPVTEEGDPVPMSSLDVMRYTLQDLEDSDNMAATMSSNEKGVDVALFSVMTINNKLELEKMKQKERIKALLAALVSNEANSPENLRRLESSR